jgi:hypothetical protein
LINIITAIGTYLITKFGKSVALSIMFATNKALLFTLVTSFVVTLLSLLMTTYTTVQTVIDKIVGLANGTSMSGGSECLSIIVSSTANALGFFDAFNVVGPTLFLVYFTYFNVILLSFSLGIYRFIDKTVTEFTLVVK